MDLSEVGIFSESDFQGFLRFLKKNGFEYETETEKKFAEAISRADDDKLEKYIIASYNRLISSIAAAKEKALVEKKAEIMSLISNEILKRYFYREGLYEYQVINNPEILEAIKVLKDEKKYRRILK